ncbi:MAG: 4Fe-4S dicluster domain-containing protein [Desulfobacterales bacterium]
MNNRDPRQVPAYKIQSTLGEIVRRKGKVDNAFMHMAMETAWAKCTCCNRCGMYCPHGIDMGIMFGYLRGPLVSAGFVPWSSRSAPACTGCIMPRWMLRTRISLKRSSGWPKNMKTSIRALRCRWIRSARTSCTRSTPGKSNITRKISRKPRSCSIWPGKTGPCPVGDGSRPAWPCLPATGKPAKFRWNPFMTPWKGSNPNAWWERNAAMPTAPR